MKVLIGFDGSPQSQDALHDLVRAGLPARTKACVLVALDPGIPFQGLATREPGLAAYYSSAYAKALGDAEGAVVKARKAGEKAVAFLKGFFPEWTFTVDAHVGAADNALFEKAEEWGPSLIVMGTRDLSRLGDRFLGSVSQKVLHHAACSVRIGKPRRGAAIGAGRTPNRILAAMDGSYHGEAVIKELLRRRFPEGTEVKLVAAMDFRLRVREARGGFGGDRGKAAGTPGKAGFGVEWPQMEHILAKAAARLAKRGLAVSTLIVEGEARETLLREAKSWKAHALFLGSRGLSGLRRILLGSVSSAAAAHADCTVEVIRIPVPR